jgi:hypothetical protein
LQLVSADFTGPNGIAFSPDENVLYVGNWDEKRAVVLRYPVQADATLGKGELFFDLTTRAAEDAIDGIKVDRAGNGFVSGPGGLWILSPAGKHLGTLRGPEHAHNMAWEDAGFDRVQGHALVHGQNRWIAFRPALIPSPRETILPGMTTIGLVGSRFLPLALVLWLAVSAVGQESFRFGQPAQPARDAAAYVTDISLEPCTGSSELAQLVRRYAADLQALERYYDVRDSTLRRTRLRQVYEAWLGAIERLDYDTLGVEGRVDWQLLRAEIRYALGLLAREEKRALEMAPLAPFFDALAGLQEARRRFEPAPPRDVATQLARVRKQIEDTRRAVEKGLPSDAAKASSATNAPPAAGSDANIAPVRASRAVAWRTARRLEGLKPTFEDWFRFGNAYDPEFSWWAREPSAKLKSALDDYIKVLREKLVSIKPGEDEPIVGDPIGREGLGLDLEHEMIPYSPEQLIAIADTEFAWCEREWKRAAQDMGLGDDWRAALERAKQDHVPPGDQPALIARQAYEALEFVLQRDLLTVPPLAVDTWRMGMMSPERQKVNPFFLGGEEILVSFPTDTMDHEDKVMSLRANNVHFCRATVFHELIPGHHMQFFMRERHNPHRDLFSTPFWVEGWALWWEMRLWDLGFPRSPENRAGMLFWRSHRCARIIFSLQFHLGNWTPERCVDFLVERVGHERNSALGEVRRSFNGDYPPLYQAGYMLGAIQLRELHRELVGAAAGAGRMTEKAFHDRILRAGPMPIEMIRALLTESRLPRDFRSAWHFAGATP